MFKHNRRIPNDLKDQWRVLTKSSSASSSARPEYPYGPRQTAAHRPVRHDAVPVLRVPGIQWN